MFLKRCKEQDVDIYALKLLYGTLNIYILTLYWAPSGNFSTFLHKLDTILQSLYSPILHFIICGDIYINYLYGSAHKHQLDNLLLSYNLYSIIDFPTRVQNTSATAIDNIFIDVSQFESNFYYKWCVWPWCTVINNYHWLFLCPNTYTKNHHKN